MPPCVIVGERDGNGITACGGYSSGDFDAKPLVLMMTPLLVLLLFVFFVSFVFLLFVVVVLLCSCFPAIFFSLENNPEFKDPIPRLIVVERSFFEPKREIVVLVVVLVVSASEVIVRSRRRKTGDDDDDDDDVVGCVFDIICKIIIVSIISRRPLLFVAERKKDAIIFTPFLLCPLLFSLSLDPISGKSVVDDDDDDGVFFYNGTVKMKVERERALLRGGSTPCV